MTEIARCRCRPVRLSDDIIAIGEGRGGPSALVNVLNDGDRDEKYADYRCTGGQTSGYDDNCPGVPNRIRDGSGRSQA